MGLLKRYPALFVGLGITLVFLWLTFDRVDFINALELKFYDFRLSLLEEPDAPSDIILVDIDEDSLEKIGRWPWPRSTIAEGIEKIHAGGPKAIGLNILYSEPEESSGLKLLQLLEKEYSQHILDPSNPKSVAFQDRLVQLQGDMNTDKLLAETIGASGDVILPVSFPAARPGDVESSQPDPRLGEFVLSNVLEQQGAVYYKANDILLPIPAFLSVAKGIGHIGAGPDPDGIIRRDIMIYGYRGQFIPSYALQLAATYLGVPVSEIQVNLGQDVRIGSVQAPLTISSRFLMTFKGAGTAFKHFSYFDVVNDKIPAEVFKDKLVIVGVTATGFGQLATPADSLMSAIEFSANTVWALLNKKFIQQPDWTMGAELLTVLVLGLIITFVFPRLKAMVSGVFFLVIVTALFGGATYLFVSKGLWITTTYPLLEVIIGYIAVVSVKYLVTEVDKEKVEEESAESNRMLGLSFQEQGRLDMAFDKFRRCPVDKGMKEILYSLAMDFERKRQFHKAVAVYEHLEEHDPKYKDVRERKSKMIQVGETVILGAGVVDPLLSTDMDTRPTLGRYEVVKQLGKGAMGIVYLGNDPRINRTTAIKTFNFPSDVNEEEAKQMKQRFFQEAESAGTLSHPNIVTIYDAGEEQDLAYIAMEFLEGHDLQRYTKRKDLLPLGKVVAYTANIAEAMDYAHNKGIVHRDIKPANIMLLDTGVIKVTDFGIARITASSQTQTGVVKGTPHYMSPEQISGQKVDGRSDIFSLGVMMFQMLCGQTPFKGDNMPALMHQIMNVEHPDLRQINPRVPKALCQVINKAMEKDREKRYQKASDMARDLNLILSKLQALRDAAQNGGIE